MTDCDSLQILSLIYQHSITQLCWPNVKYDKVFEILSKIYASIILQHTPILMKMYTDWFELLLTPGRSPLPGPGWAAGARGSGETITRFVAPIELGPPGALWCIRSSAQAAS